ncbi:MAG: hypothetical protein QXH61_08380 [Candidatus Nezhaarchaeales archaeon]
MTSLKDSSNAETSYGLATMKFYYRRTTAGFLKNILMLINEDVKLYTTLSITIDCEGSVCT